MLKYNNHNVFKMTNISKLIQLAPYIHDNNLKFHRKDNIFKLYTEQSHINRYKQVAQIYIWCSVLNETRFSVDLAISRCLDLFLYRKVIRFF